MWQCPTTCSSGIKKRNKIKKSAVRYCAGGFFCILPIHAKNAGQNLLGRAGHLGGIGKLLRRSVAIGGGNGGNAGLCGAVHIVDAVPHHDAKGWGRIAGLVQRGDNDIPLRHGRAAQLRANDGGEESLYFMMLQDGLGIGLRLRGGN